MEITRYNQDRDRDAAHRIHVEVGWAERGSKRDQEIQGYYTTAGGAWVGRLDDETECLVTTATGNMRYVDDDIPFTGVTGVTTGHIARKHGLASRVTARAVASDVADGAMVAWLGMFDQGFYDRIGFAAGPYDHSIAIDPSYLNVPRLTRRPVRLGQDDWKDLHACRVSRMKWHGAVTFDAEELTHGDVLCGDKKCFGLGFRDDAGELTHFMWLRAQNMGQGRFNVVCMAYRDNEQFIELMSVIKSLEDQSRFVRILEPPHLQIQDLLSRPLRRFYDTEDNKLGLLAECECQLRVCDVIGCLERTHLRCHEKRVNLDLTDPIGDYLPDDLPWRGTGGQYIATLGPQSSAEPGTDPDAPMLKASINAFSRMWLGTRPASGLAVTDKLSGSPELLEFLDHAFRHPQPRWDWRF